jgi:hypothetical protein
MLSRARASEQDNKEPEGTPFTDQERSEIERMASIGLSRDDIGFVLRRSPKDIEKHCMDSLSRGRAIGVEKVGGALMRAAIQCEHDPRFLQAAMFYLRCIGKWREESTIDVRTGPEVQTVIVQVPGKAKAEKEPKP